MVKNLNKTELKNKLVKMKKEEYSNTSCEEITDLLPSMLEFNGDLDSQLRDDLIYSSIAHWTLNGMMTEKHIQMIVNYSIVNDNILYGLDLEGVDVLIKRSFNLLMIPVILYLIREDKLNVSISIEDIKKKLIQYVSVEIKFEGYIHEYGWVHNIAHWADGLEELAQTVQLNKNEIVVFFRLISDLLLKSNYKMVYDEEERLGAAVMALIGQDHFRNEIFINWLSELTTHQMVEDKLSTNPAYYNSKKILKDIIIQLEKSPYNELKEAVLTKILIL